MVKLVKSFVKTGELQAAVGCADTFLGHNVARGALAIPPERILQCGLQEIPNDPEPSGSGQGDIPSPVGASDIRVVYNKCLPGGEACFN